MNDYPVHYLSAAALDKLDNTCALFRARATTESQASSLLLLEDDDEGALWARPNRPSRAPATLADASAALCNC